MVPNLGPPDVLGLQLPEAFTTTSAGQNFWELKQEHLEAQVWGPLDYRSQNPPVSMVSILAAEYWDL